MYGEGISKTGEIIDLGVEHDIIEKAGAWFSYKGEKIGQGRESVRSFLNDNPPIMLDIENQIKAKVMPKGE